MYQYLPGSKQYVPKYVPMYPHINLVSNNMYQYASNMYPSIEQYESSQQRVVCVWRESIDSEERERERERERESEESSITILDS